MKKYKGKNSTTTHKKVESKIKSTNVRKRSFIFIKYILIVIFLPVFSSMTS